MIVALLTVLIILILSVKFCRFFIFCSLCSPRNLFVNSIKITEELKMSKLPKTLLCIQKLINWFFSKSFLTSSTRWGVSGDLLILLSRNKMYEIRAWYHDNDIFLMLTAIDKPSSTSQRIGGSVRLSKYSRSCIICTILKIGFFPSHLWT